MRVCVLASGSKGNVTYIETKQHKILLDVGRNFKYIKEQLAEENINIKDIDYVLISHLHDDHISALYALIKNVKPNVCLTKLMLKHLPNLKEYNKVLLYEEEIYIDDVIITSIKSSHDSIDSRNFIIEEGKSSVVYITDTGYINVKNFPKLYNKNIYLMESNHDIELLNNGPYPIWLKKRVLSDVGHLSNKAASFYLTKLIGPDTKKVLLMHLSEVNNTKEKSLETLKETFKEYDVSFKNVKVSDQYTRSEVMKV
jgi:phosphoribosyl 1,2-cyclic phosphodiesterase